MSNTPDNRDSGEHLRSAIVYLLIWIAVIIVGASAFSEAGIPESLSDYKNGNWIPVMIAAASIVLMALLLKSLHGYFISKSAETQDNQ